MRNFFTYNGRRSSDFGVFISGTETFGAPERDVERVTIPGKNGDVLLDNGRYKNIRQTYPAFIPKTFDTDIGAFRAFIASNPGYRRLEDTYHPDEYYKAAFIDGLEAETGILNHSGQFDINFERLPERWLKSGEVWTEPVMPCGNVAVLVGGGTEVDDGYDMSPFMTLNTGFDATLVVTPEPNHQISELADLMIDDDKYALHAANGSQTFTTNTILPQLISTGRFSMNAAAPPKFVQFSHKNTDGYFIWTIEMGGVTYKLERWQRIINPTEYTAKPLIRIDNVLSWNTPVYRSIFALNGVYVYIDGRCTAGTLFYDCELGDCYSLDAYGNAVNQNAFLTMKDAEGNIVHEYPTLLPGTNNLEFGGDSWLYNMGMSTVSLQPRWWTL